MPPIGIVTRNRHEMLDITLRSLSAADLPDDQELIVFDDGSDRKATLEYLYTDKIVFLRTKLPQDKHAQRIFGDVKPKTRGKGLKEKIRVVRLANQSQGVVNASCAAFRWLVERYGAERGIIIMQDDVVFNENWLERMLTAKQKPENDRRPVGLIAGCWINKKNPTRREPMTLVPGGGITAQCYLVTPEGIAAVMPWAQQSHGMSMGFDNKFCAHIRTHADLYRMHPAVCQHIGVASIVRPKWSWYKWNTKGRIDFSASGPYPLARHVRYFKC